jgi:hypothetical protein
LRIANATASTFDDNGEAHVFYEEDDEEDLTKEDLQEHLEAYGKELFKDFFTELCLLSITLKIGRQGISINV